MARIRLLHWKASEAGKYLIALAAAGHTVQYDQDVDSASLREWRTQPSQAFVIDLSRLPARGREIAIALRQSPATRRVPLVFCDGAPEKIEGTRALLPDAVYCEFSKLRGALRQALSAPPVEPAVPMAMMQRYAARTTAQKLGIEEACRVSVIDPPRDYLTVLGDLPAGVEFMEDERSPAAVLLCFVHDLPSLQVRMSELRSQAGAGKLWFCWRKGKAATGGVSDSSIRATGVSLGLVDYKVCSLNDVWSGMLFALKR
jgi:CheY-like chemotaxis protein